MVDGLCFTVIVFPIMDSVPAARFSSGSWGSHQNAVDVKQRNRYKYVG